MLKELSLLKWQEKATKLSSDDAATRVILLQEDVSNLETNLTSERYLHPKQIISFRT